MSFNLFASPSKDDISVGYIDPTLGYVDGVSICEANNYAKDNPGTTFIFVDGDNNIQYLNINEVNRLTTNNLVSTATTCAGIQAYKECGPPRIQFFGGGGIGAVGNPVIGKDGSLLAVDLVYGGNGYQYPPIVAAKDDCQFGNGAVLTAILGETADEIEVYEGEDDFEEYELCEDTDVGYGTVYGRDGEEIGPWEPKTYTKIGEDPIKREIEIYQRALENPFWTTRKTQPDRIIALGEEYSNSYNATHPEWGEFMNQYAISPVKPSDLVGSDEAGKVFTLEWEQNFPISGEYIFRGVCDNSAQVYIDNSLIGDLLSFKQNPSPLQKTIREGNHIIRIDLFNAPIEEDVAKTTTTSTATNLNAKFVQKGSNFYLQVDGSGTGEISFVMDVNDASYIAGLAAKEVRIPSENGKVAFKRTEYKIPITMGSASLTVLTEETIKKSGTFSGGKTYGPIEIIGAGPGARGPIPIKNSSNKLALRDADGDDENIKITITKVSSTRSTSTTTTEKIISSKSWNQNPVGVSMLIEAPTPIIPQEQPPIQTGRCPPNPIWSTRFPGSVQKWYPVRFTKNNAWSTFMNRYAISPVPPLNTPGSDTSGSIFSNSWDVDLPYAGYYGVKGTRDNRGRILIDGKEISTLDGFNTNNPKLTKVYLTKGKHTITVEVYNIPVETNSSVDTKIFSTQDWRVPAPLSSGSLSAKFIQEGTNFYLKVDGSGTGKISFVMDVNDASYIAGLAAKEVQIPSDSGKVKLQRTIFQYSDITNLIPQAPTEETIKGSGTFTGGKKYGPIQIIGAGPGARGPIPIKNGSNKLALRDADGDDENIKITISNVSASSVNNTVTNTSQSPTKNGVNYDGPELFGYVDSRWSKFMNDYSVSPKVFTSINSPDERVVGKYILTWKNINFPQDGSYKFNFQSDNIATLKVGGKEIYKTSDFNGDKVQYTFNASAGTYDIVIELENIRSSTNKGKDTTFSINPMGVSLYISKDVTFSDSNKTPWTDNPMAISAILIPPPCAKKIGGKGVVDRVIVEDPGNGYLPVEKPGTGYPVTLVLDQVIVESPGINYRCGEDQIQITPNNGSVLDYTCDSFGRITEVKVLNSGVGFNAYPQISMPSETGVNASFRPVFRIVRDPLLPPEKIIQVTDLVGLKQTGYVDGRAYYGAVYYDQGIRYAGYYKTIGTQIRVYDTLQESITAKVTTTPSAIQRSGTDITSNDPTLNIPGTPQSATEQP